MRLNLSSIICYVKSLYLLIVDSQMNLRRSRLSSYAAAPVTLLHSKYEFQLHSFAFCSFMPVYELTATLIEYSANFSSIQSTSPHVL